MLTTIETCRLQERNIFEYLTAAVEAHIAKRPAPSLLPALSTVVIGVARGTSPSLLSIVSSQVLADPEPSLA
jgi:hypothetical protein